MDDDDKVLDELARRFHAGEVKVSPEAGRPRPSGAPGQDYALSRAARVEPARAEGQNAQGAAAQAEPALDDSDLSDDTLRGTLLAQRFARRRGYGLPAREPKVRRLFGSWGLLVLAALGAWSFAAALPDIRYWLSSKPAVDVGHLGAYADLTRVPDGAFVHLEGVASPRRGSYSRLLREHEVFPLVASRFLIDRPGSPDASLRGYGFRYAGSGRLWRASHESRYEGVRDQFVKAGELASSGDVYVIEDGVAPRTGLRAPLELLLWGGLCVASLTALARRKLIR